MATKVFMEALSPTMEEGKVLTWHKKEGDQVSDGDVLAEVETDKAVMELQARGAGVLRRILASEGAVVEVGHLVAVIAAPEEDIGELIAQAVPRGERGEKGEMGEEGEREVAPVTSPTSPTSPSSPRIGGVEGQIKSSPLARRLARERGLDLRIVRGSGPGGRITKRDVEAATEAAPAAGIPETGYQDIELSQIRKTIAKRLAQSLGPIPHFFLTTEIDMARAVEARDALNALGEGPKISFNDIILKVVAAALLQHRECNAWWLDGAIRYFNEVHLSMAVAVEDGLITPVIRNAHLKSLRELAAQARELAERARARRLTPEEYTGGTFSVSNLGMFDIDQFTAVISPPEAGILAVGSIIEKPVVLDGDVTVRKRMRVTMSCDHRVIDGATGARFLQTVRRMLENPLAIVW